MLTRREAIKTAFFSTVALAAAPLIAQPDLPPVPPALMIPPALTIPPATASGLFVLPPLPYAYDALEPYIDAQTMQLHHDKHHAAYVKNLNAAITTLGLTRNIGPADGEQFVRNLLTAPSFGITDQNDPIFKTIRNNGGGHYNHSLFWTVMKKGGGGKPTRDLASAIDKQFGSYTAFQEQFTKAALGQFGSGWAWLSIAPNGTLKVEAMPNQDNPVMQGRTPLLGIDVWEHAYYLKYNNRRPEYVAAWYNTINWDFVNDRYTQLRKV